MASQSSATNTGVAISGSQLKEIGVKSKAWRKAVTKALARGEHKNQPHM